MNKKKDYKLKTNSFLNFKEHLEDSDFVFLSAPFGLGKTTFIKDFISSEENKSKYNFFHLYPVHYAVNKNEDVFELVKYDLLFELLKQNDITEEIDINYKEATKKIAEKNIKAILLSFVEKIPEIGKALKEIIGAFKIVEKEILELYEQEFNTPELNSFINKIENTKGSIFENDIITTYINNKLVEIKKGDSEKENILILDDLDRIDPEHIFRLLNIFSANFDNSGYSINKFGIDKVIIVADYYNVKSIYHHKYGKGSDFEGYINKFYSNKIYFLTFYDAIKNLFRHDFNLYEYGGFPDLKINLIALLFNNRQLSFRQLRRMSNMDFNRGKNLVEVLEDMMELFNGDYKDLAKAFNGVSTEKDGTIKKTFWGELLKYIIGFYYDNGKEKIEVNEELANNEKRYGFSLWNNKIIDFEVSNEFNVELDVYLNLKSVTKSMIWKEFLEFLNYKYLIN
ncbi:hypothetical protein H3Z83_05515 [Tenacibaculum sp. S7007]|uniref:KAP NTPase domain-containing protein n=1 Tax=Tenacibaculum pelagium TaxID=2759527 RepID=A0A839ANA0_9FLAO|nr:P-loop NTPase fold protein [Tenacibaculum pelagium]MBA6155976.1 hypothetical protein [Tenacibaculum pelagium]